MTRFIKTHKNG